MAKQARCDFDETIPRWPYVQRCKSDSRRRMRELETERTSNFCSIHADDALRHGWVILQDPADVYTKEGKLNG